MKFKKICGLILAVVAAGLTSCSSDLNNEEKVPVNPNETAKRMLSISTGNAKTRSEVNIDTGNKWVAGDRFMAYNRTFTGDAGESRYGILTAHNTGEKTSLDGTIACKNNDELGIFYPGTYVTGHDQSKMSVDMTASYINGNKGQDGSMDNLKYFDYSYGTGKVTANGSSASGSIDMKMLYSIMELDFTANGVKLTNIRKLVLSNVYTKEDFNLQNGSLSNPETGSIVVNSPVALEKVYVAILPQFDVKPIFEVYTEDNKAYRFAVNTPSYNFVKAKVYSFTVQVKEFDPNPYIEIGGVKWGKYNLQYSPGTRIEGWKAGYHLAKNPWDYFYTARCGYPLREADLNDTGRTFGTEWDHFRWCDIETATDYQDSRAYWTKTGDVAGQIDPTGKFGDLAAYVSNGKWQMPTAQQFADMMSKTGESMGYFVDDQGNTIYGVLFDPTVSADKKGWILDKNGNRTSYQSNASASPINTNNMIRQFTKADFKKAIFFPMAGKYDYNGQLFKPGTQAAYWLATGNTQGRNSQAAAFVPSFTKINEAMFGYTKSSINAKQSMYSIRPIYVGQ